MAPIVSSNRSVRIVDAVSVYVPDSPKPTTYSMSEGSAVKGGSNHFVRSRNQNSGFPSTNSGRVKKASHHLHGSEPRQSFFLNKLFRSGSTKTPYNSFRHTNSTSHDDRSHNDESTNTGSTGVQFMTSVPIDEYDTATDTEGTNDSNTQLTTIVMPPSPLLNNSAKEVTVKPQPPPERRKFFMDKLFTVSRMHVSEAGITSLSPNQPIQKHVNNNHRNASRSYKISSKVDPIIKSRITYSIDGDTTTTNSSVGVDEDVDEFSFQESMVKSPKDIRGPALSTNISKPAKHEPDFPTTTILMTADQQIMEVQTDRFVDTPTKMEAVITPTATYTAPSMRTTVIPPTNQFNNNNNNDSSTKNYSSSSNLFETVKTNVPPEANRSPVIQYIAPLLEKVTGPKPMPPTAEKEPHPNSTQWTNNWGVTSSGPDTTGRHNPSRQSEEWSKSYYGSILDRVTKIQCITSCSDMDLARCDDTIEDYVTSPLNAATKVCSRNDETTKAKTHRSSANSILKQDDQSSASNSIYTDGEYEDDDLGTYDDSMISASLFDIDTLEDEYTYSTFENEEEHGLYPHKNISSLPIHIQKSLLSDPSCSTSKYLGDDDGTSYSSQNSAWL